MSRSSIILAFVILCGMTVLTSGRNSLWADPIKLWSDSAMKSPNKPRPWVNLARAEKAAGNYALSISAWNAVRIKFPDNVGVNTYARVEIAGIEAKQYGQLDKARLELERILVDVSEGRLPVADALAAYNNLAFIYAVQGRGRDALALLDTLVYYDPTWFVTASAHYHRGLAFAAMHECAEANGSFRMAQLLDPSVPMGSCS